MVVNSSHVKFYQDIELLGIKKMPRPLTDCFNNGEGILVGGTDMEVGQLRFYPRSLSLANIEEIYAFGSTLADIATVDTSFCFTCFDHSVDDQTSLVQLTQCSTGIPA